MNAVGSGSAPGKVILLGEHSVVFGQPAIAASVARRMEVDVREAPGAVAHPDPKVAAALVFAAEERGLDPARLSIEIRSEIPPACGLGSSAALSLALVRALAALVGEDVAPDEARARASRVEDVFHGTASGVDVATSASGGVIWFERAMPPRIERLRPAAPVDLVVALSGDPRSTAGPVGRLRARNASRPELYGKLFRLAGEIVGEGRAALEQGDWAGLGALMDVAHGLLNGFGVSTPTLERMVAVARAAGALGAKLSGAGGGGVIVALAPTGAADVQAALRDAGFEAFVTTIGEAAAEDSGRPRGNDHA